MSYTPGPWLVHSSSTLHMNDVQIASVYDHWRIVSHIERGPLDGARNANLIAAAPDLLEACEVAIAAFGGLPDDDDIAEEHVDEWRAACEACAQIRAAIAKARGEP